MIAFSVNQQEAVVPGFIYGGQNCQEALFACRQQSRFAGCYFQSATCHQLIPGNRPAPLAPGDFLK